MSEQALLAGERRITALEQTIRADLFALRDEEYRAFHSRLVPTLAPDRIIGVRTPVLRRYARRLAKTADAAQFLRCLPHYYYEENNLHAFLLESLRDFDTVLAALDEFLPFLDNWATCDGLAPPALAKNLGRLREKAFVWIADERPYIVRYGIGVLMRHFLDERFSPEYPEAVASLRSEEYYVNMMIAWYFATALAKQYDAVLPFLQQERLAVWTHNKAIQKAVESYRITPEQKTYLKTLKRRSRP